MSERSDIEVFDLSNFPNAVGVKPPDFQKAQLSLFSAEHAVIGSDIVFHFYPEIHTPDMVGWQPPNMKAYWDSMFPGQLDTVAREHFKVDFPRLKACHVQEFGINSWWLRAYGFGDSVPDVVGFVGRFYEKLNHNLELLFKRNLT